MTPTASPTARRPLQVARVQPSIDAVRSFWGRYPLFSGEAQARTGERAFFEEHEKVLLYELSGKLDPIFTRDVRPRSEVLDVGCGIGFWVHQFCRLKAKVSACDLSAVAVQLTRRRLETFQLTADVQQGNAEQLPYAAGSFDHVNCYGVIHHTPDTQQCIREFHRVLKPGGTVCVAVYFKPIFLRSRPIYRVVAGLMRPWVMLRGRGRENMLGASSPEELVRLYDGAENPIGKAYTKAEIKAMLAGRFDVMEDGRVGFPRRVLPISIPNGLHKLLSRTMGLMIVCRCRKMDEAPFDSLRR